MATQIPLKNISLRNTLKVTQQSSTKNDKTGKVVPGQWRNENVAFVPPGQTLDIWLDSVERRIVLEEVPT